MFLTTNQRVWVSETFVSESPCNHEEAVSRIFLHALPAFDQHIKFVLIKAGDTDLLILAVSDFGTLQDAGLEERWS